MSKFGNYIKAAREVRGLTQSQVAGRLGYKSPQFISNVERGICGASPYMVRGLIKLYRLDKAKVTRIIVTAERERWVKALA